MKMKKIYLMLIATFIMTSVKASLYVITIFGTSYSPATQTVVIGDVVTIQATSTHTLAEVSAATWAANGTTTLSTGFGTKTSNYTFTVTAATQTLYFVCQAHVSMGMKGQIILVAPTGITPNLLAAQNINLWPNPTSKEINFSLAESVENINTSLISISGQLIPLAEISQANASGNKIYTINIPATIAPGVYFLEIKSANEKIYKKIVITN